jgi:hypothetical protein
LQTDAPHLSNCARAGLQQAHTNALVSLRNRLHNFSESEDQELLLFILLRRAPQFNPPDRQPNVAFPFRKADDLQRALAKDLALNQMLERQIEAIRFQKSIFEEFEKYDLKRMIQKMRDPNPVVRSLAIQSAAMRRLHCEEELINRLKDPVPAIRAAAHAALVHITRGANFGPSRFDGPTPVAFARERDEAIGKWRTWLKSQSESSSGASQKSP